MDATGFIECPNSTSNATGEEERRNLRQSKTSTKNHRQKRRLRQKVIFEKLRQVRDAAHEAVDWADHLWYWTPLGREHEEEEDLSSDEEDQVTNWFIFVDGIFILMAKSLLFFLPVKVRYWEIKSLLPMFTFKPFGILIVHIKF